MDILVRLGGRMIRTDKNVHPTRDLLQSAKELPSSVVRLQLLLRPFQPLEPGFAVHIIRLALEQIIIEDSQGFPQSIERSPRFFRLMEGHIASVRLLERSKAVDPIA